jgi:hypothetical protein
MRSRTILCFLALAVLGSNAPSRATSQTESNASTIPRKEIPRKEGIRKAPMESAEVKWRVVGLRRSSTAACPEVPDWPAEDWLAQTLREPRGECQQSEQSKRPQVDPSQVIAAAPVLHDLGLDRFCVYTYRGAINPPPPFPKSVPGLASAANGQMALVPSSDPDTESAHIFAGHFLDQTSGIPVTLEDQPLLTGRGRVRLAFLDTQPDSEVVPQSSAPSQHGYTLAHLAEQLLCQYNHTCPIQITTRLALAHSTFDKDHPPAESLADSHGGNLGLVDELASAIVKEVLVWLPDSKHKHLILNLSLGWDGEMLGELDKRRVSQLKPDAQLVYNAIRFARRSGALVIAAAGNRRGGEESKWPLLPAAWELRRPSWVPFPFGHKLLYAAGGVDWQGLPLPNYRRGGMPRRVAFGDHATVITTSTEDTAAIYTGSSVSTAVVSSIAAAVWQQRPELGAAEVMKLLDRSGDSLPSRADYYAWRDLWPISKWVKAPHIERLSLCQAVAQARKEAGLTPIQRCQTWDPEKGAADFKPLVTSTSYTPLPEQLEQATLPAACNSASNPPPRLFAASQESLSTLPEGDKSSCPLYLLPDMISQHWVAPQPDDPPCPGCTFVPPPKLLTAALGGNIPVAPKGYVLIMKIDPKWLGPDYHIDSAAIDIDRYSGAGQFVERMTYAIPPDVLAAALTPGTHQLLLSEVGNGQKLTGCTATLNFKVTVGGKTYSVPNPIYVDP